MRLWSCKMARTVSALLFGKYLRVGEKRDARRVCPCDEPLGRKHPREPSLSLARPPTQHGPVAAEQAKAPELGRHDVRARDVVLVGVGLRDEQLVGDRVRERRGRDGGAGGAGGCGGACERCGRRREEGEGRAMARVLRVGEGRGEGGAGRAEGRQDRAGEETLVDLKVEEVVVVVVVVVVLGRLVVSRSCAVRRAGVESRLVSFLVGSLRRQDEDLGLPVHEDALEDGLGHCDAVPADAGQAQGAALAHQVGGRVGEARLEGAAVRGVGGMGVRGRVECDEDDRGQGYRGRERDEEGCRGGRGGGGGRGGAAGEDERVRRGECMWDE